MSPPRRRRFRLTLEAIPPRLRENMSPPVPVEVRLRMALKCLLRSFGLRCVTMPEELPPEGPQGGEAADRPSGQKRWARRTT
jgi:hypothetical protein